MRPPILLAHLACLAGFGGATRRASPGRPAVPPARRSAFSQRTGLCGAACLLALLLALPSLAQASPLFEPIAEVLRHPRCMNCHTVTDFPRQGDERRRHAQFVVRGEDGHGAPTLQCAACHQDRNIDHAGVPGAPHWHLAPLSMGWEGLDDRQLCQTLIDRSRNGDRGIPALVEHMRSDALVLWGWNPGAGRTLPPLDHPTFMRALEAWAAAGAPC